MISSDDESTSTPSEKQCPHPNVKQSSHLGQNTKPVKNAATAASFVQHTEEAEKTERGGGGGRGFTSAGPSSGNS